MTQKIKILLVEDDINLGFVVQDQLKNEGYDVCLSTNGSDGLQKEDKVEGFKSGADDYITKPFSTEEFLLRVKAILKRVNLIDEIEIKTVFQLGDISFDSENYKLDFKTEPSKKLTKKESQILLLLVQNRNKVLTRDIVLNAVWGQDDYFVGRSLDVFITKLRKYLKVDERVEINNIHGVGFKLITP